MKKLSLTIGHLYGLWMNTYGDDGNIICLKKRCEWRGIKVEVKQIPLMYDIKKGEFDLYFFGGGQDQAQMHLAQDLVKNHKGFQFTKDIEDGVPLLSICGGYQLLGKYYQPFEGKKLEGVGIFPAYTKASRDRMIGNIVIKHSAFSNQQSANLKKAESRELTTDSYFIGFENHSGKTFLQKDAVPLGSVIKGFGNNGEDATEGCIYKNAIGCYMHGSLLPKNPLLADWLIKKALEIKYGKDVNLNPLDDELEEKAHETAVKKFR